MTWEDVVASARRCVGAPFRLQGRDVAMGLDCVGVAAIAMNKSLPPATYAMRGRYRDDIASAVSEMGLREVFPGEARSGDLLMVEPGPGQLHIIVMTPTGFVHADARLRRVVETPGRPGWPILCAWRGCEDED